MLRGLILYLGMKKLLLYFLLCWFSASTTAQSAKTEMYDLLKKLIADSTGYPNVGDWAVEGSKMVKWKDENLVMSDDTSINFYRRGTTDITIKGKSYSQSGQPVIWNIMLKGPRMGYTSFSIISSPSSDIHSKLTIDSVLGKKPFKAKLLKSCDQQEVSGYYYYELEIPKKDVVYLKLSWLSVNGNTAIRIDCYDSGRQFAAKLNCPK
jgi:hypothetical protein